MAIALREVEAEAGPGAARATLRAVAILLAGLPARDFAVRLWDGSALPPSLGQRARFTIVLTHPASLRRMLWPPGELTAAEAFVRRDFEVKGDLIAALGLRDRVRIDARILARLAPLVPALLQHTEPPQHVERAAQLSGGKHTQSRDAAAVRHHYDAGNDFYALWLDEHMVYSCAYFERADATIDEAQEAKLDLVCKKLRLGRDERFLDIGCGWGGLVMHAAERYGASALGLTLSPSQAELARERIRARGLARRCRVELVDYRALREEPFDKIASVGMVEHVGVGRLGEYFHHAARLLRPGGLFLNHGIAPAAPRDDGVRSKLLREGRFLQRYVFPDSELPFLHETAEAAMEAGLELRDVESLREHYALTLRRWLERLERQEAAAVREVGTTAFRIWRLYLAGAAAEFDRAGNTVYQTLYVRPVAGKSGLPLTRAGWAAPGPAAATRRRPSRRSAA
jgi:cyclopropane-fatty-acyl-phospholipid synthase